MEMPPDTRNAPKERDTSLVKWLNPGEQAAWRGLLRMQAQLSAHLGRGLAARSGLSLQDYGVLVALEEQPQGRLRAYELGCELGWEKSRLSHHIARMQSRGLVERVPCPGDQRGQYVVITGAGRRALDAAAPAHVTEVRDIFVDRLSPAQLSTLAEISAVVLTALEGTESGVRRP